MLRLTFLSAILLAVASGAEAQRSAQKLVTARELREASNVHLPWDDEELVAIKRRLDDEVGDDCTFKPEDNKDCPIIEGVRTCIYCPFTKCWSRSGASFEDASKCDPDKPEENECAELSEPFPVPCPEGLEITWEVPSQQVKQNEVFNITTHLDFGSLKPIQAPCNLDGNDNEGTGLVPHANVHGCVKTATTWWCSELVPAFQPKSVVTSPTQCFNETNDNVFDMKVASSTLTPPNEWTLYAHYYFYTGESSNMTKWHVTIGGSFLIEGRQLELSNEIAATVFGLELAVLGYSLIVGILVLVFRKHWVMVASSVGMCLLMIFGGALGAASVFAFDPTWLNDTFCTMRLWLLPFAFDFMVIPMCLKTWRVHKLFSSSFSRVKITNRMLFIAFAVVILIEAVFNTLFMVFAPLKAAKRYSSLDGNAWERECIAEDPELANIFTILSISLHLLPCLALTFFAYSVRLSFKYSRVNRKLWEFDESLYIMLALLNLTVVGLFVIIFQAVIESNPNSVTMMRAGGISWIVAMTLGLMFVPKFFKIYSWDPDAKIPQAGSVLGPETKQSFSETNTFTRGNALRGKNPAADVSGYINTLALEEESASSDDEEESPEDTREFNRLLHRPATEPTGEFHKLLHRPATEPNFKSVASPGTSTTYDIESFVTPTTHDADSYATPSVRTVVPSQVGPPRRPSPPSFIARMMGHSRENSAASVTVSSQVDPNDDQSLFSLSVSETNLQTKNPLFDDAN